MKTIVVAGGAGFVGSHCAEYFAQHGWQVKIIDNLSRGTLLKRSLPKLDYNLKYLLQNYPKIEFFHKDLRDFGAIAPIIASADALVFAAGQTAVTTSLVSPREDLENNLLTTFNALESIRLARKDIPFIYCSTNKVYGDNVNRLEMVEGPRTYALAPPFDQGIPESFPVDQSWHTPYGTSKLAADLYVQDYARTYGLATAVFRMSCIYGPRQLGLEDQGWVAHFIAQGFFGNPLTIYGTGKQVRDLLYVEDLVKAFDLYFKRPAKLESLVVNVGGGPLNAISLLDFMATYEKILQKPLEVKYQGWRDGDQKVYVSDIRKAKELLQWAPAVSVTEGLQNTLAWISRNPHVFPKKLT